MFTLRYCNITKHTITGTSIFTGLLCVLPHCNSTYLTRIVITKYQSPHLTKPASITNNVCYILIAKVIYNSRTIK